MFTEEQIASAFRRESATIEGLGTVWMRELTEEQFTKWLEISQAPGTPNDIVPASHSYLIPRSLCDETGKLLYPDPSQFPELPHRVMKDLAALAHKVMGIGQEEKDLEEQAGNSEAESTS